VTGGALYAEAGWESGWMKGGGSCSCFCPLVESIGEKKKISSTLTAAQITTMIIEMEMVSLLQFTSFSERHHNIIS